MRGNWHSVLGHSGWLDSRVYIALIYLDLIIMLTSFYHYVIVIITYMLIFGMILNTASML